MATTTRKPRRAATKAATATNGQLIYTFSEGNASMRALLGGKGAGLAEMTNAGLPVPPGFTITTEACNAYYAAGKELPPGLCDDVVAHMKQLEQETVQWCREMLELSPFALRLLKASFHAEEDWLGGIQQLAHDANLLFYASDEAKEGREAYKAKRKPDFAQFPKRP